MIRIINENGHQEVFRPGTSEAYQKFGLSWTPLASILGPGFCPGWCWQLVQPTVVGFPSLGHVVALLDMVDSSEPDAVSERLCNLQAFHP